MARKKNASFQGVDVFGVDVDAPSFRRAVENGVGDTALIYDMLTGLNGEANTIDHSGDGRGCPLGLPLVNQRIFRNLNLENPSSKDVNGGTGQLIFAPYVIFLPPGEDTIVVVATVDLGTVDDSVLAPHLIIRATDMTLVVDVPFRSFFVRGHTMWAAIYSGLGGGQRYFVFPQIETSHVPSTAVGGQMPLLRSMKIHHGLAGRPPQPPRIDTEDRFGVTEPTSTEMLFHKDFDEGLFANERSINGYVLANWNRNLNAIDEFMRRWPAGGNLSYVHVDHDSGGSPDSSNPARSRFDAHTRSLAGYPDEPEIAFPLWSASFGAFLASGKFAVELAEPPTIGCLEWFAPWPEVGGATNVDIRRLRCLVPDFQSTSSNLKCAVLIGSDGDADVGSWNISVVSTTGTSATVAPVACDGTNDWWLATVTAIPFTGDGEERFTIRASRTGAKSGVGELCFLAACLYFEP